MKFLILGLAVAALSRAQNTTLIPASISDACSTFLSTLNNDSTLSTCVQPLINATASFAPTSGGNLSSDDVNYTLGSICKNRAGCDDSTIRTWLSSFYSSCQAELTGSDTYNAQVRELYDILYVVNPLKAAVCAIDSSNQKYCINEIIAAEQANGTSAAAPSASGNGTLLVSLASDSWSPVQFAAENLYIAVSSSVALSKRMLNLLSTRAPAQANFATIITPNTTTYRNTNLPFLFLQPSMSSGSLCTPCTREIMVSYITWESKQPYALGLSQSPILGGQSKLWSAINSTCGQAYVNAITSEVGSFTTQPGSTGGAFGQMEIPTIAGLALTSVLGLFAVVY